MNRDSFDTFLLTGQFDVCIAMQKFRQSMWLPNQILKSAPASE